MSDCVRRRRLIRAAVKVKSLPGEAVGAGGAAQSLGKTPVAAVTAAQVPQVAAVPTVLIAEPVEGAVGPIVVPVATVPSHPQPQPQPEPEPQPATLSPAAMPASLHKLQEAPSPAPVPVSISDFGAGKAGLLKFLQSVRCEQYMAPLVELGASEVLDLKDMEVSAACFCPLTRRAGATGTALQLVCILVICVSCATVSMLATFCGYRR